MRFWKFIKDNLLSDSDEKSSEEIKDNEIGTSGDDDSDELDDKEMSQKNQSDEQTGAEDSEVSSKGDSSDAEEKVDASNKKNDGDGTSSEQDENLGELGEADEQQDSGQFSNEQSFDTEKQDKKQDDVSNTSFEENPNTEIESFKEKKSDERESIREEQKTEGQQQDEQGENSSTGDGEQSRIEEIDGVGKTKENQQIGEQQQDEQGENPSTGDGEQSRIEEIDGVEKAGESQKGEQGESSSTGDDEQYEDNMPEEIDDSGKGQQTVKQQVGESENDSEIGEDDISMGDSTSIDSPMSGSLPDSKTGQLPETGEMPLDAGMDMDSGGTQQGDNSSSDSSNIDQMSNSSSRQKNGQTDFQEQSSSSSDDLEETTSDEISESIESDTSDSPSVRKDKLQQLRDRLQQYAEKKKAEEEKTRLEKARLSGEEQETQESEEEKYELSEHTNQFLQQLHDLPSFENRERGPGYAINTSSNAEVSDSIIRTLITKFLNRRFCKRTTDLNIRSNSLDKTRGFYKWEVKDVITHLETHQVTKVFDDKYGYQYANGKNESVPLSFYFDMSGSMANYTGLLAVIAIELLKKNVKVLIGFNERVNVQIESIKKGADISELAKLLEAAGYSYWNESEGINKIKKNGLFTYKFINSNLDNYLIDKKAEKCVVFSDFDPIREVCNLSNACEVYWFCFEEDFGKDNLSNFHGFIYKVNDANDIADGLIKVNENRFEALCFTENPKELKK